MREDTGNDMESAKLNKLILAIVILSLTLPMAFIAGVVLGGANQGGLTLTADSLSSWISALATAAIAVLTFILAKETWYLREAQSKQLAELQKDAIKPFIDFSLVHSRVSLHLIEVKIANYGRGIAKNVKFRLVKDVDGISDLGSNPIVDGIFSLGAVSKGISNLGIGQVYKSFAFGFLDILSEIGEEKTFLTRFSIEISYSDIHQHEYRNTVLIDMSSFAGIVEVGDGDPLYKISTHLEKMNNWMSNLTKSSQRISVNSYDKADRDQETEDYNIRRKEYLERRNNRPTES